jgi:hypothetical protein
MKKIAFGLFVFISHVLYSQQSAQISDSLILHVLDNFINELDLETKKYKMIRMEVKSFMKEGIMGGDTINSAVVRFSVNPNYNLSYFLQVSYEVTPHVLDLFPPEYYTIYRTVPIILNSGLGTFVTHSRKRKNRLKRRFKKYFQDGVVGLPVIWNVEIVNGQIKYYKSTD